MSTFSWLHTNLVCKYLAIRRANKQTQNIYYLDVKKDNEWRTFSIEVILSMIVLMYFKFEVSVRV